MGTIKVKPWGNGQGDHVLINEEDFDPAKHELFGSAETMPGEPGPGDQIDGQGLSPIGHMTMRHKGRGVFDVLDAAGEVVQSGLSKDQAQAVIDGTEA